MSLTLDKPMIAVRSGQKDDELVLITREGYCNGIEIDKPMIGLRAGQKDGQVVYLTSDQKVGSDGNLIIDKPYIGTRAGQKDGQVVYVIRPKSCGVPCGPICTRDGGTNDAPTHIHMSTDLFGIGTITLSKYVNCPYPKYRFSTDPAVVPAVDLACLNDGTGRWKLSFSYLTFFITYTSTGYNLADSINPLMLEIIDDHGNTFTFTE